MRPWKELDHYRDHEGEARITARLGEPVDEGGLFEITSREDNGRLKILASNRMEWDHVSVSREDRAPTWAEMEQVKRLFFRDDETVMQLHVPADEHVNFHPFCLHLWRPQWRDLPRPPRKMVAP